MFFNLSINSYFIKTFYNNITLRKNKNWYIVTSSLKFRSLKCVDCLLNANNLLKDVFFSFRLGSSQILRLSGQELQLLIKYTLVSRVLRDGNLPTMAFVMAYFCLWHICRNHYQSKGFLWRLLENFDMGLRHLCLRQVAF